MRFPGLGFKFRSVWLGVVCARILGDVYKDFAVWGFRVCRCGVSSLARGSKSESRSCGLRLVTLKFAEVWGGASGLRFVQLGLSWLSLGVAGSCASESSLPTLCLRQEVPGSKKGV